MASRILAKLATWGKEPMPKADLTFYLQWLKDQLTLHVSVVCVSVLGGILGGITPNKPAFMSTRKIIRALTIFISLSS